MFGLLEELPLSVVGKEAGVGIACGIVCSGEGDEDVNVTVPVEVVTIDLVIDSGVLVERGDLQFLAGLVIDADVELCAREDEIEDTVVVEVGGDDQSVGSSPHPFAVTHVGVNST